MRRLLCVHLFLLHSLIFCHPLIGQTCRYELDQKNELEESNKKDKEKDYPDKNEEEPPKSGNFSLPSSQQPSGLFAFGGNVIDKGEIQAFFFADDFVGSHKITTDFIPGVVFGMTDDFSIFVNFSFLPVLKDDGHKDCGIGDVFVQLEYAFYNKKTTTYIDQATIVGNVTFPSGSVRKNPQPGFGSSSFFIGGTFYRMMTKWFMFTCEGFVLTTTNNGERVGNQFLYQFGLGRSIPSPEGRIYAWMIEVDGQYNAKNKSAGHRNRDSGGNSIYVTPSLWLSSKEFLLQFGVSLPVYQNLCGHQRKFNYALNLNVAWSFY